MRMLGPHRRILVSAVVAFVLAALVGPMAVAHAAAAPTDPAPRPALPFHIADQFVIGGDGGWGSLEFDSATRRLFISRATTMQVVDADGRRLARALSCAARGRG